MKRITQKLLCLSFLVIVQSAFSQNWLTEGPLIDNITANTSFQQLAIDSNNNNYILLFKTTVGRNFVLKYDGSSWATLGPYISDGSLEINAHRPQSIAIDNNDDIYVAYVDASLTNKVAVKKWDGSSWVYLGLPQGIAVNGSGIHNLVLKIYNNTLYITYYVPNLGVVAQLYDENTNSWNLVGGFNIASLVGYLDLAINSTGDLYVAYQDVSNNNFTTIKMFDGTDWILVGNSIATFGTLQRIDFKNDDTPIVAFRDGSSSRLAVKEFNGASWSDFGNLPTINPVNSTTTDQSFTIDNNNKPYIAYTNDGSNQYGKVITLDTMTNNWIELPASNVPTGTLVLFNSIALDSQDVLHYTYRKSSVTKCVVYNATLSTENINFENNLTLYPNPTTDTFAIKSTQKVQNVILYDIQGKTVKTFSNQLDNYDISDLNSGIYFVKIKNANGEVTKKLIKN